MSKGNEAYLQALLADKFRQAVNDEPQKPTRKATAPFSLRLSPTERARLEAEAGNQPLGAYIRSRLLGEKVEKRRVTRRPAIDHKKLAMVLAELGRSRLASNINQLAKAANIGALDVSPEVEGELQEACQSIASVREALIDALGVNSEP